MYKKLLLAASMLLYMGGAGAASYTINLTLSDTTIISYVTPPGKPVFTIPGINTIVNTYTVTGFEKAYPSSRFAEKRKIYKLTVSSLSLPVSLTTSYPAYFPHYEIAAQGEVLSYTPNDFNNLWPYRFTDYLKYINAEDAWGVTQGNPNVVVGLTDLHLHTSHPDLAGKIAQLNNNGPYNDHGTMITGLIVAGTDNNTGTAPFGYYPSIGFNCRVDFIGSLTHGDMLTLSKRGRKVLNGSWRDGALPNSNLIVSGNTQELYQEIYEEGTFTCFAAGNGHQEPWKYIYPASYDYVFSTTGLYYQNPTSGWHNDGTDTIGNSHQHNPRVDIAAPSYGIGGITYNPYDTTGLFELHTWDGCWGTSCASPLTAGTAALILSVDPCYTPYQLEYILKKSANAGIYNIPENMKYAGRLGAGALDAGKALENVRDGSNNTNPEFNCNYAATQTFFIEGIDINTVCAPGHSSNGAKPTLTPVLRNGTPNYTYRWEYLAGNNVTLSALNVASPQITASAGNHKAVLRLTVYDGSPVQKVASRYFTIQLTTANTFDLAGRDSYMDMLDEPNTMTLLDTRETQYYMSPDLWNRQLNDGKTEHENAEYFTSAYNYANVTVRNAGCASYSGSTPHYLKLYWTVASTGENWSYDWDGNTQLGSAGPPLPNTLPAGGEITSGSGILIPALQPGQSTTLVQPWRPAKPQHYDGAPDDLNVCLLARIENPADLYQKGMTFPEVGGPVITNVQKNNNIFTRNLWVKDLNPSNRTARTRVLIANANDYQQIFDVQFINDKAINLHFAGNFSAIGHVKLYLGKLYDIWKTAGAYGKYLEKNDAEKWVITDGSEPLELLKIPLAANAKYPVDVEFTLHPDAVIPDYRYDFHLRQFKVSDIGRSGDVYGSMSFQINTRNPDGIGRKANEAQDAVGRAGRSPFAVYPNPVKDNLKISYQNEEEQVVDINVYDVIGRKMLSRKAQHFRNSSTELDVSGFVTGVYFITLTNNKGINERFKFVKE